MCPIRASFFLESLPFPSPMEPPDSPSCHNPAPPLTVLPSPSSPRVLMVNPVLKANLVMLVLKATLVPLAPLDPLDPLAPL